MSRLHEPQREIGEMLRRGDVVGMKALVQQQDAHEKNGGRRETLMNLPGECTVAVEKADPGPSAGFRRDGERRGWNMMRRSL
jgi:hypothetical protein